MADGTVVKRAAEHEFPCGDYRLVAFRNGADYDLEVLHVETKEILWRGSCYGYKVWTVAAHLDELIADIEEIRAKGAASAPVSTNAACEVFECNHDAPKEPSPSDEPGRLLPCPFCSAPATVYGDSVAHQPTWKMVRVYCNRRCVGTQNYATREEAIAAWNRRASTPAPSPTQDVERKV